MRARVWFAWSLVCLAVPACGGSAPEASEDAREVADDSGQIVATPPVPVPVPDAGQSDDCRVSDAFGCIRPTPDETAIAPLLRWTATITTTTALTGETTRLAMAWTRTAMAWTTAARRTGMAMATRTPQTVPRRIPPSRGTGWS
jgi:hypothetical protein